MIDIANCKLLIGSDFFVRVFLFFLFEQSLACVWGYESVFSKFTLEDNLNAYSGKLEH